MTYPILPLFLSVTLGAGPAAIGIIEGVADATASVLKLFSGVWSDRATHKKPLILFGYTVSGFSKPLIGITTAWTQVLALRFLDRVGKGIRTSPRDALISQTTHESIRGHAFGFHRAMDHLGAAIGPMFGLALVSLGLGLRAVFYVALIPATLATLTLALFIKETPNEEPQPKERFRLVEAWRNCGSPYRAFLGSVTLFALGNSTDAFLLLRLGSVGVTTTMLFVLWSLHHVVKMSFSAFAGKRSDKVGRKPMIVGGWAIYALVYLGFGLFTSQAALIGLFLLYGVYFGFCEPAEKAMVADLTPTEVRGTAFGLFHFATGIAVLPASLIFGILYQFSGPLAAFGFGAGAAGLASLLLAKVPTRAA